MDNKSTTKRMIGAVVLVLIAALLLAWLLKGKNQSVQEQQELIAGQTQESAPILGFPGVNEDDEMAEGGEQASEAPYVIGSDDQEVAEGTATQQAGTQSQDAADSGTQQLSAAGQDSETADTAQDSDAAVSAANEGGQSSETGFQVRDSQEGEQRQIVENGEVKPGVGSMGANSEVAQASAEQQAAEQEDSAQQAADAGSDTGSAAQQEQVTDSGAADDAVSQQSQQADTSGSSDTAQPTVSSSSSMRSSPSLVNEKPVPPPATQASSRSSGASSQQAASSRSRPPASSGASDAGGEGYAIQVVAASSRNTAERIRKPIAADGYPTFIVRANVNGKQVYRVRIGTYPARGAAQAVQKRMQARYKQNQYVQNSFVTKN